MRGLVLGIAVAAVAALTATPAAAQAEVLWCGFTPPVPCGVCVDGPAGRECVEF